MSKEKLDQKESLRQRATALVEMSDDIFPGMSADEIKKLVHELRIHQIELEIQNEELRTAQVELALSRDGYSDLYNFAPVGYVTLDRNGVILEANLTAGQLLGISKKQLLNRPLSSFISGSSQEAWYLHRREVFSSGIKGMCELEMKGAEGVPMTVQLQSLADKDEGGSLNQCRTALIDVTVMKEAEKWHIEAERLREMADKLPAGAVYVDSGNFILNKAAEEITGYMRDEISTLDEWFEKLFPGSVQENRAIYERLRANYFQERSPEVTMVRKDGGERIVEFTAHRFDGHEVWLMNDLTEKIIAERELRRSQYTLHHIADAVLWARRDARIVFANDAACELLGYDRETLLETLVYDMDEALTSERWPDWWKRVKSEKSTYIERDLKTAERGSFAAELFVSHLEFGDEEFVCGIVHDITERREAELALAGGEELLRAILNSNSDGIVTINSQGIILLVNPAVALMTGYGENELVGCNVSMLMPSPHREKHPEYLRHYHETGEKRIIGSRRELKAQRKDGTTFPMDLVVSPVKGLNMFTGVIRDLSEQKKLEGEILNAVEQEITRISAELHDGLGSALTGINMCLRSLLNKLTGEQHPEARNAETIVRLLGEAIHQSRLLAKGLQPVGTEPEALVPALTTLVDQLRSTQACKLMGRLKVPETPVSIANPGVSNQLYRIAQEASHNAIKYSKATELNIKLSIEGDQLILTVSDNGVGFDPAKIKSGGLGLHIMEYRAQTVGGSLTVTSRKGGGTEVQCYVPMQCNSKSE